MASILIADDDPTIRQLAKFACEKAGHQVAEAGDIPTALALYSKGGADLVLLDVKMPGGGGDLFLRTIRGARGKSKILLITGATREVAMSSVDASQVDDILLKPFRIGEVVAAVEKLLGPAHAPKS